VLDGTLFDVTKHKAAEEKLNQRNQELFLLNRLTEISLRHHSMPETLTEIATEVSRFSEFPYVAVEFYDSARQVMVIKGKSWPSLSPENSPLEIPCDQCLSGMVARSGQILIEGSAASAQAEARGAMWAIGTKTFICVPLMADREVIGVLSLGDTEKHPIDSPQIEWATSLANHLALLVERNRAEENLRETSQQLRHLFDHLDQVFLSIDMRSHRVLQVSPACEKIFGYTAQYIFEHPVEFAALMHPTDQTIMAPAIEALRGGRTITMRHSITRKDGVERWVEFIGKPLLDEHGALARVDAIITDITERHEAEIALRESEQKYRTLFESSVEGIFLVKDVILDCNEEACRLLGCSREEVIGTPARSFYPKRQPMGQDSLEAALERRDVATAGLPQRFYWCLRRKDGTTVDTEVSLKAVTVGGENVLQAIVADISDRRRSEKLQSILYHISEAASMSDNLETLLDVVRRQLNEMLDATNFYIALYDLEQELYSFPYFADQFDDRPGTRLPLPNTLTDYVRKTGIPLLADEVVFRRLQQEGEVALVGTDSKIWLGVPLRTAHGVIGVMAVQSYEDSQLFGSSDLDLLAMVSGHVAMAIERKRTQDALLTSEEQLRQAQKLEAIGRLAGGVAHDFNNLLTSILGHSELTLAKLHETDPLKDGIEQVVKAAERAASLTRQLLAFSRKQILQPRAVDLNAIVLDMEKMLRRLIGEDIDLVTKLDDGLGTVKADPGQMEQVLMNLVVNARDAMPGGGRLVLETNNVNADELHQYGNGDVPFGNYIRLSVSDRGTGMSEDVLAHIFEPFFTTKDHGKGTGLGLSTVYGIVKQSGGYIRVRSTPGQGTTFDIFLPRVFENAERSKPRLPQETYRGNETILVVEDEEGVRELVQDILECRGYKILAARDCDDALRIVRTCKDPIDLLLTDVIMPQMSGDALAHDIQRLIPGIKILFMSGYIDDAIVQHDVINTEANFLAKPFSTDALTQKVRALLDSAPCEKS
jgi:PAS domain S-box-containing protein